MIPIYVEDFAILIQFIINIVLKFSFLLTLDS